MTDRDFLWLAQACYLVSVLMTILRLRRGGATPRLHRLNMLAMVAGFILHTAFMYLRGQVLGRCPLTTLFEAQVFITWAAVFFYLLVGTSYRVSFLGAFTAPLVLAICLAALIVPIDVPREPPLTRSPWVEFHAAIAALACGAFGVAGVASVMYLVQQRQLKTRRLTPSFLQMPSIAQLEVISFRLIVLGFVLLTAGMLGGMISYRIIGHWTAPKMVWAVAVWVLYGLVLLARPTSSLVGRRMAIVSIVAFVATVVGYWGINLIPRLLQGGG